MNIKKLILIVAIILGMLIQLISTNAQESTDTVTIVANKCPYIKVYIEGYLKSNRKLTLNFSGTVIHPNYPLDNSKTFVTIEDTETGENVVVTYASNPDSQNIRTNALTVNKLDFLIKTPVDKTYRATVSVEDTRGDKDTKSIEFTVKADKAPIGNVSARAQELRNPSNSNKAEIFVEDGSYSEDGDYITRAWTVAVDTNRDGSFTDETYVNAITLEGFQDLSGNNSLRKIRFLKSGIGKVDVRVKVKEVFGQPAIDAFVTEADRMFAEAGKVIDVINVRPVVEFSTFQYTKTNITFVVGSLQDQYQTSLKDNIAQFKAELLAQKIDPTINIVERSGNPARPSWNQQGGSPYKSNGSLYGDIQNMNTKWIYETDITAGQVGFTYTTTTAQPVMTVDGKIVFTLAGNLYLFDKNGTLLNKLTSVPTGNLSVLPNNQIVVTYMNAGGVVIRRYDSNLNYIGERSYGSGYSGMGAFTVDFQGNMYFAAGNSRTDWQYYYDYKFTVFKIDIDGNQIYTKSFEVNPSYARAIAIRSIRCDTQGNMYLSYYNDYSSGSINYEYYIRKYSPNGNEIWNLVNYGEIWALDEANNMMYIMAYFYSSLGNVIHKMSTILDPWAHRTTDRTIMGVSTTRNLEAISSSQDYLFVKDDYWTAYKLRKSDLAKVGGFTVSENAKQPVVSNNGGIYSITTLEPKLLVNNSYLDVYGYSTLDSGKKAGYSSLSLGSDGTLYLIGCYWNGAVTGPRNAAVYDSTSKIFFQAIGTGGTEQNVDNTIAKVNRNIAAKSSTDFVVSVTDKAFTDNSDINITNTANLIKSNNDTFTMMGTGDSIPDGIRVLNNGVEGGIYDLNTDMSIPLQSLKGYVVAKLGGQGAYTYTFNKGDYVSYDAFYSDYEKDPSKKSWWRYIHTPLTDGTIPENNVWISSPITTFTKNGTYRVQHYQTDSTGYPSYDLDSNISEIVIYVEAGTVAPPAPVKPVGAIALEGSQKQNRRLALKLLYSDNNKLSLDSSTISWTLTPISGMTAADIKYTSLAQQSIDTLYKKPGTVRATVTFKDVAGNAGSETTDIPITSDLPIIGSLNITPVTYRDTNGKAKVNVLANIISPDDYIHEIKYYLTYDSDNDGSFTDETKTELTQFQDMRGFDLEVNNGVGDYKLDCVAVEGFQEPTIAQFVGTGDYSSILLSSNFVVDNTAPMYDIRTDKTVYLVGETINYTSYLTGNDLKGNVAGGYSDPENDPMVDFTLKYIQDKSVMPNQDAASVYHDVTQTSLISSLDRAGEYTIQTDAWDDPKNGDARFNEFKRNSGTKANAIIVHRPPVAATNFLAAHDTAAAFDFGNNMYLDGTHLRISDASYDPDGFPVTTTISYKVGNGSYATINSGDTINLSFGQPVAVKITTVDNWGAEDTQVYNIKVINNLNMQPDVIPNPVAASESIVLKLVTNQYATKARAVVFGSNINLALISETATSKVWQATCTVASTRADSNYSAQFYAFSEGLVELRKDKTFGVVTPIDLVPGLPSTFITDTTVNLNASTTKYANAVQLTLFKGTAYETTLPLTGTLNGSLKNWTRSYTVPNTIPAGQYIAEYRATTPNGNSESRTETYTVQTLSITGVTITGYWNHWRGQTDMFGKVLTVEPHRFLSYEKVQINVTTVGNPDKIEITFSPELESMLYTDPNGNVYRYQDKVGYLVIFPFTVNMTTNSATWEFILPLAPSTKSWDDAVLKSPYWMKVTAFKGAVTATYAISDINITGNVYDLIYIQPAQ